MATSRERCCTCDRRQFGFAIDEDTEKDLVLSQWTDRSVVYALYRTLLGLYTLGVVVYAVAVDNLYGVKILIWLTYWAYFCLTGSFLLRTLTVWMYVHRSRFKERKPLPKFLLQIQWILINISNTASLIVFILFWSLEYKGQALDFRSANTHAVNVALMLADLVISRYRIRIQHVYVVMIYSVSYAAFTAIYWAAGGTNHKDEPYIYSAIDFSNNPLRATLTILVVPFIAGPLLHCVVWGLVQLRVIIWRRCCRNAEEEEEESREAKVSLREDDVITRV